MAEQTKSVSSGMKPWLRVLLVASLALNLLIIGTLGGAMLTWSKWRSHHPGHFEAAGGPLTRALDHEDRREIGQQMRKAYRAGDLPRTDMRAELEGLIKDLKADPFDVDAVKQRMESHRQLTEARFTLGQSLLLEHLSKMSPEARSAYADRLRSSLKRRGGDKKWKRDHKE